MNKKNILYLECTSGISGDMTVGALIDLGADKDVLLEALYSIPVDGFKIEITRVNKSGLDVCDFNVILDDKYENHDHNMNYLHGHEDIGHAYSHKEHIDSHEEHHHEHRGLKEIFEIITNTKITENAKKMAIKIFEILAKAESKAHGIDLEHVHFHEVGAVDSIVDIIAVAVCMDNLSINECIITALSEGTGTIRCQHGILPVPVPAVLNIVKDNQLKISITNINGELVTPTGAAIAAAIKTNDNLPDTFTIVKTGMGAGKRKYERPSILRAMLINVENNNKDYVYKLESNIDDSTGEALGYVMEKLFEAGARDVHYKPVFMKKNRPAYEMNVLCEEKDVELMEKIMFEETTTIGIRKQKMERTILKRRIETFKSSIGEVKIKVCSSDTFIRKYPEYESIKELCAKIGSSYQEIYSLIERECNE